MSRFASGLSALALAVALGTAGGCREQSAADATAPGLSLSVSSDRAAIGEPFTLLVLMQASAAIADATLDTAPLLATFDVRRVDVVTSDTRQTTWRVELAAFEPGPRVVPALPVTVRYQQDGDAVVSRTPPANVTITSPSVRAEDPLRPPSALADAPAPRRWPLLAVAFGLLALVGVPLVLAARNAWRRSAARRARLRFWRASVAEMSSLARAAETATGADRKAVFHRASALLRRVLIASGFHGLDGRTSQTVIEVLEQAGPAGRLADVGPVLEGLDRERFGAREDRGTKAVSSAATLVTTIAAEQRSKEAGA